MTLAELIPAEFFVPMPTKGNDADGRITIGTDGKIVVSWERSCSMFKKNLEAARNLKLQGFGNFNGSGWAFGRQYVVAVLNAFPTLFVDSLVEAAAKQPMPMETRRPNQHGKISLVGNAYAVVFGGNAYPCQDKFQEYLNAARNIRKTFPRSRGWNGTAWMFDREAASDVLYAFPATWFEHPPELAADALKSQGQRQNQPMTTTAPVNNAKPDPLADRLLSLADDILG